MRPDRFEHRWDLSDRETQSFENSRRFLQRVGDVVPFCKRDRIFGPVSDEDTQIVHPGGGEKHVFIEGPGARKTPGDLDQTNLMRELVRRFCLRADIIDDSFA